MCRRAVCWWVAGLLVCGCKSEDKPPAPKPAAPPATRPAEPVEAITPERSPDVAQTPEVAVDPPPAEAGTGTIAGIVRWDAPDVNRKTIDVAADPNCVTIRGPLGPLQSERLIARNNVIENAFVYIKSGLPEGRTWPVPAQPVQLDQKGCHYEPHVFGVLAGQTILIRNSDSTAHNIHAVPKNNTEFNRGQPKQGMTFTEVFNNPEIGLKIKCDVHPWMSAYCHVMAHPFFAVSAADGTFTIADVPAGTYVLTIWLEHPGLQPQTREVTVTADDTVEIEFTYAPPGGN